VLSPAKKRRTSRTRLRDCRDLDSALHWVACLHSSTPPEPEGRRIRFLRHQLPPALLAEVDLDTLEITPETPMAEDLRADWSDLVYRLACRGGGLEVYLLFEHKSQSEHWTCLQLLRYVVASGHGFGNS
jgi:hypothetical protein